MGTNKVMSKQETGGCESQSVEMPQLTLTRITTTLILDTKSKI